MLVSRFVTFLFVLYCSFWQMTPLEAKHKAPHGRKLLFIMDKMYVGGTERSLINLLSNYPKKTDHIYVYLLKRGGPLEAFLRDNPQVQIIDQKTAYKSQFDVVISYAPWIDVALWVDAIPTKRRIQWIHTDNKFFNRLGRSMQREKKKYEKINSFICVSQIASNQFKKQFPQVKEKVHPIYNIFDNASIIKQAREIPDDMILNDGIPNIVTVARLSPEKCLSKAIAIHKLFEKNGIHFRWYVVGEGNERPHLEKLIHEAHLDGKFILLGQKTNPYKYIKAGNIFALLSSSEGFGMVISEAKVLDKPILVTNFPAAKEQIKNGVTGLIVEHDIRSIYEGLEQLLLNPHLRQKLVRELEGFTFDNSTQYEKMEKLFFK